MELKTTYAVDYVLCGLDLTTVVDTWEDVLAIADVTSVRKNVSMYIDGRFDGITNVWER